VLSLSVTGRCRQFGSVFDPSGHQDGLTAG